MEFRKMATMVALAPGYVNTLCAPSRNALNKVLFAYIEQLFGKGSHGDMIRRLPAGR